MVDASPNTGMSYLGGSSQPQVGGSGTDQTRNAGLAAIAAQIGQLGLSLSSVVNPLNITLPSGGIAKLNPHYFLAGGGGNTTLVSSIGVMAGFGMSSLNSWRFTPSNAGNVVIGMSMDATCNASAQVVIEPRFADINTSTAPSPGTAITGSAFGTNRGPWVIQDIPVSWITSITGLTIGHTYWFDFAFLTPASSTAQCGCNNPSFFIMEMFG
jgi:hypothetical protein